MSASCGSSSPPRASSQEITVGTLVSSVNGFKYKPNPGSAYNKVSLISQGTAPATAAATVAQQLPVTAMLPYLSDSQRLAADHVASISKPSALNNVSGNSVIPQQVLIALQQCVELAVFCFKSGHNPNAINNLNLLQEIQLCLGVINGGIANCHLPNFRGINCIHSVFQLKTPLLKNGDKILSTANELITIASDVNHYLNWLGFPPCQTYSDLGIAIQHLENQFARLENPTDHSYAFLMCCIPPKIPKDFFVSFSKLAMVLIQAYNEINNIRPVALVNRFEIVRKFGQFPSQLATHMLECIDVLGCLTSENTQGFFGCGKDDIQLSSYSPIILGVLNFAVMNDALPSYFGGNFRIQRDVRGGSIFANNPSEHDNFCVMMNNLNTIARLSDKDLFKCFYDIMIECINNNNNKTPVFITKTGELLKCSTSINFRPMCRLLYLLLSSQHVDASGKIDPRPFTVKQLIMLSCISVKAFAEGLFIQGEDAFGIDEMQQPSETAQQQLKQLINYILDLRTYANQNS